MKAGMKTIAKCLVTMIVALGASYAGATTYTVNSSQSTATIQGVINGTVSGSDTVVFSGPGTYNITAGLTLKCGVTYTGPTVTPGINGLVTPTVTLAASARQTYNIFNLFTGSGFASPCTQPTVIEYLNFANTGGIYVQTSFTNLTIQFDTFSNIPCCTGSGAAADTGIYFDGNQTTSNTAQSLTSSTIQWNLIGDTNSCTGPTGNAFTDLTSPSGTGNANDCNGIIFNTAMNGVTVQNNNFFHVSEGAHMLCPSPPGNSANGQPQPCEVSDNGVVTDNVTIQQNDFNQNHRVNYEEQPQNTANINFVSNSIHDMVQPVGFSFGLSFACCNEGTGNAPNGSNNVIVLNTVPTGRYGYGIEGWGKGLVYNNNLVEEGNFSSGRGIAWGGVGGQINNNTVCGAGWVPGGGYISDEGYGRPAPSVSGNTTATSCSAYPSIAPSINPAPGTHTFPLTVTFSDSGYTSGPVPQGNTGIWYTTDGSNPVPGAGTAKYASTGGTISLAAAGTVRAVGMWGARNQPGSYASGYGFTPSAVVSASYSSSGPSPTLSGVTASCASGSLIVGASLQCTATCSYSPGSITDNCTNADQFNIDASFASSNPTVLTVTGAGVVSGQAAGTATVSATAGTFTSPTPASVVVTAPTPTLISPGVFITCGGVNSLTVGQTLQCTANCTYTGNITTNCTTTDTYGTLATPWVSSIPGDMSVTSGGFVQALAVGAPIITTSVPGFTRQYNFTVNPAPPTATLTGVSVMGASSTVTAGQTLVLTAQCSYSDLTTTNCTTTDSHGTLATGWTSSVTGVATIGSSTGIVMGVGVGVSNITVSAGSFTSPATGPGSFPVTVTAIPSTSICGNNQVTLGLPAAGMQTFPNFFNSVYCVTGTSASGYTAATGAIFLPSGAGQQLGALWDLVVIPATSGTAQAATAICKGTYTVTSTTGPGAFVSFPLGQLISPATACHLSPSTAYWIGTVTNTSPGPVPEGFWSCGATTTGQCTGSLPSLGNGTYPYRFVSNVYGSYTNMTTTLSAATAFQPSSYVTLTTPAPTLTGGFLNTTPTSNVHEISVGQTAQFIAFCSYSDSTVNQCFPTPDQYGNTVISWSSSNMAVLTVGATGSNNPGLAIGISGGIATVIPTLTGNVSAATWAMTSQSSTTNAIPGSSRIFKR